MASLSEIKGGAATTTPKAKSLAEIKGGARHRATESPQPIPERTTRDKWQDRSVGFAQSLLGTAVGTAKMFQTAGQGIMAALHPTKTFSDIHEEYGLKSLKNNTPEGQSVTQSLTPKNKEQQQGKLVGDLAQFIAPATKINKATAAMPWLQRTVLRTVPDVVTSIAQNQGAGLAGDETTKNAGITAITSGVANALIPSKTVSKTSEFFRTLAPGYVGDVATGLAGQRGENRDGAKAFIPGMGTAFSATMGTVQAGARTYSDYKTGVTTVRKRTVAFDDLTKKYNRVGKAVDAANKKGVDAREILTSTNILNGAVDADGTVSVERALQNFDEFVQPYEGKVREAIQREGSKVRIADVASAMDDFAAKSDLNGAAFEQLNSTLLSDLRGLQRKYGDNIPVEALHDTKIFRGSHSNYMDTGANAVNKEATRFFKDVVEKNVRSLDVQQYNAELSKLYAVQDVIESLSRTKVKGARLGKYFASAIGTGIGASSGNPLLAILGAEIGSRTNSAILSRSLGGNITKGMEVPGELTDILARQKTGKDVIPPVEIPRGKPFGELNLQSSSKVGSRNMSQPATMTKTKKAIPNTILPVKDFNNKLSTGEKYQNAKAAAIAELDVELNELSQAGYRYTKPSEVGGGSEFVGVPSTFPKWVPEHLRSKSLFDTVMPMVEKETPPPPHASKQLELYNVLQEELQKRIDNPRKEFRAPKGNSEVFAGAGLGFEEDEDGNLTFSPEKALVGMVGVAGLTRSQAVNKLSKNLDDTMRRVFTEFVDVVRLKKYKMVNGRMVFDTPEAEKAFDEGIKFVNGAAIKTTENFASKTPAKIADLFDDVVKAADNKPLGKVTPKPKPAPATALLQEAKKYKSAEEFVNKYLSADDGDSYEAFQSMAKPISIKTLEGKGLRQAGTAINPTRVSFWEKQIQSGKRPPIVIKDMNLVDGHHRLTAYKNLNEENVPVLFENSLRTQLTDIWKKANKAGTSGGFDGTLYHGAAKEIQGDLKFPLYLSDNKGYASKYMDSTFSSMPKADASWYKLKDKPQVLEFKINPNAKVFDTRNSKDLALLKEYQSNYSEDGKALITERGLPEGIEGTDIQDFLESKGLKYDGMWLDEKADRGLSFVAFNKNALTDIWKKANK